MKQRSVFLSCPGHYGLCASFVTLLKQVTFIQGEGLCSRLCLNLCNYSESGASQLNGPRPDSRQVKASYTSYAWLLFAQYHVCLGLHSLGLLLPVSCIINSMVIQARNFENHVQFADLYAPLRVYSSAENSVLQALQFQEVSVCHMFLRMCARPWLQSFRYGVSISSSCRK
jgi:hypothetical protein